MIEAMSLPELWQDLVAEVVEYAWDDTVMVLRILLAAACGAAVGWQRERHEKAAGLRTHMLLAIGACLFTLVGTGIQEGDVTRVLQGMVTGTGFLAGGVIFREGATVRGLTTAVGLWVMGAVGMAIGFGEYFLGVVTTVLVFTVLSVMQAVEGHMARRAAHDAPASATHPAGGKRAD
jgi:putative Mg2+ transporter-C (MgtC) family protein